MFGTTFEDIDRLTLGKYDGTYLSSTYVTTDEMFEVLLLGASIGSLDRLKVGCTESTELWISYGRVFGTTHGTHYGINI